MSHDISDMSLSELFAHFDQFVAERPYLQEVEEDVDAKLIREAREQIAASRAKVQKAAEEILAKYPLL